MKNRVIYISGSISNDPDYIKKFDYWKRCLQNHYPKAIIKSPPDFVKLKCGSDKERWADAMVQCLDVLKECTDIFIIPDDFPSKGRDIEIMFADYLGINFISYYDLLNELHSPYNKKPY
jgi:hypothetical protein